MSPDPEPPEAILPPELPPAAETAAVGAAVHAAAGHGHHGPFHTHCENCGTKLEGPWCHRCGQHDFEFHRSFWHVFMEALETLFHFEGKFFRNIVTLLFRPGRLTADFNAGKRAAQMPPFRLYIFVSFVFFLLISLGGEKPAPVTTRSGDDDAGKRIYTSENWHEAIRDNAKSLTPEEREELANVAQAVGDKARQVATGLASPPPEDAATDTPRAAENPAATEAPVATPPEPEGLAETGPHEPAFIRFLEEHAARLTDPVKRQQLAHWIQAHIPHMMMFCLPLFALYTRVLYRKAGQVYLQHLVVSVHFHTFIYLWVLCTQGWTALAELPGWGLDIGVSLACNAWLCLYPFLMLRHLFAGSWPKTVVKTGLIAFAYTLTLSFGFFLTAVLAFLIA